MSPPFPDVFFLALFNFQLQIISAEAVGSASCRPTYMGKRHRLPFWGSFLLIATPSRYIVVWPLLKSQCVGKKYPRLRNPIKAFLCGLRATLTKPPPTHPHNRLIFTFVCLGLHWGGENISSATHISCDVWPKGCGTMESTPECSLCGVLRLHFCMAVHRGRDS